jgi:hypothetical protein
MRHVNMIQRMKIVLVQIIQKIVLMKTLINMLVGLLLKRISYVFGIKMLGTARM